MRAPALSIRATVLVAIVLGMVVPALAVLALDTQLARSSHESAVQRNRAALMVLGTAVVTEPAWTLSEPGLRDAVQRLLREPGVCAVEILDVQPAATTTFAGSRCAARQPVVLREAPVRYEGQTVARLRVAFDDTEIDQALAARRRVTLTAVAAQVVVGVLVLAGVLALRLLRPLDELKRRAGLLAARQPVPTVAWGARDELGQLGRHLDDVHSQVQRLIDELERKNAQLHKMAMYDHLTGLPNRTLLRELFAHEAASARREHHRLALLFIDLDHFKAVNDTLGHAAGDELLLAVARRLAGSLREADILCRMGGDEFLVLLPRSADWDAVADTAERLLRAIEVPVTLPGGGGAQVTASIGIAVYPDDGSDFDALARTADLAMYRSKELGRNRYSFFHADLDTALRSRLELERELQQAVPLGQLRLHWQPVLDVAADGRGRVAGCEALLRWQHPQRGLLGPDSFIGAAEHGGLIHDFGAWALEAACAQYAAWRAEGVAPPRFAVNLSALQLRDDRLLQTLRATLARHAIGPGVLELELTESMLLGDTEHTMARVAALRAAGARLAIDDFGTGYSSLSYLKRLKPDKLKIDRSFVRDLPGDAEDRVLTEAIAGLARTLDIEVVAEGVETEAQRALLCALGCTLQQGYLHARPMPAEALFSLLARLRSDAGHGALLQQA